MAYTLLEKGPVAPICAAVCVRVRIRMLIRLDHRTYVVKMHNAAGAVCEPR